MDRWTKYPEEVLLVGKNWTPDLDGATIASALPPEISAGTAVELEYVKTEGDVTKYWLRGGAIGDSAKVSLSITTSEGETLAARATVKVSK